MSEIYIKNDVESLDLEEQGVNRTSNPINMCDINAINSDNNLEIENKIDVEEGILGLDCLKKELVDDDHDQPLQDTEMNENDYKINIQEVLMDTYDTEIKNEETVVKSENIKQECVFDIQVGLVAGSVDNIYCDLCGKDYAGYCSRCSSLSHCLSNNVSSTDPEWNTKTIPTNILEIKLVNDRSGVFAVRTIPKSVILGPFEGVLPIESTTGNMWKMKDKKLVNAENGNWMQHVCSTGNALFKNLDTFQFGGYLYYQTTREVNESDELLVCYREEEMQKSDNSEECYYIPIKLEQSQKVFACTLCCLGFRLEKCLTEHKSKCPHAEHNKAVEEIIECRTCNIWLEKQEYEEHHQVYCSEIYPRVRKASSNLQREKSDGIDEIPRIVETSSVNSENSNKAENNIKPFSCDICKKTFRQKSYVYWHKYNQHSNKTEKNHKCTKCPYQTNYTGDLNKHMVTHSGIKQFQCNVCDVKFAHKTTLKRHIENKHLVKTDKDSGAIDKKYKCSVCPYQTQRKYHLQEHMGKHSEEKNYKCAGCSYQTHSKNILKVHVNKHIKPFNCDICKQSFGYRDLLKIHIKEKHSNTCEKDYKCSECSYQTNIRKNYKRHMNTHTKPYQCDVCGKGFSEIGLIKLHVDTVHSSTTERNFRCSECSYQTNYKSSLTRHLNKHIRINYKNDLERHLCNQSEAGEEEYKCSECSFRTNHEGSFKTHLDTHINPFQCDICKKTFNVKDNLKTHIKNVHSKLVHKCPQCSFETKYKSHLKNHLFTHTDLKQFECDLCEKGFNAKSKLVIHMKTHLKFKEEVL